METPRLNRIATLLCLLGLTAACVARQSDQQPRPALFPATRPNFLIIMLDDLGKEWVSACGAQEIETPNVDALAQSGMRFKHAYCMPQCTPTRVTLFTGQYPFRHGWVNHWDVPRWGGGCHFDPDHNPSIARIMQSAGYKTAAAGKWQVNDFRVQPDAMARHGLDQWCMWTGYETGNPPSGKRYWDPYIHTNAGSSTHEGRFGEDVFTDSLIDFMDKNRDDPLFMYYALCLPHGPLTTTPLEPDAGEGIERHKAMVRYTDAVTGRLVDALEAFDLRDNTIIIWTTDNGSSRGFTGTLNGRPVKGGKAQTTENGICVPFIINGPGFVPSGVVSEALIDFTDLLPTCAELAIADLPDNHTFDGHSIADVILGKADRSDRTWIMAMGGGNSARLTDNGVENMYRYRDRVIRNERYKLFVDTNANPERLIDLTQDPAETTNLIDSDDEDAKHALAQLSAVINLFPKQDNDPIYTSLPPQPWDVKVTAESQFWKR